MQGRVLGLDHGTRRVGIALSDALRITAQPFEVVARPRAVARVTEIVAEYGIREIVIGLPTSLRGGEGPPAAAARLFGQEVATRRLARCPRGCPISTCARTASAAIGSPPNGSEPRRSNCSSLRVRTQAITGGAWVRDRSRATCFGCATFAAATAFHCARSS